MEENKFNKADIKLGEVWLTRSGDYVRVEGFSAAGMVEVRDLEFDLKCQEYRRNLISKAKPADIEIKDTGAGQK